MNIKKLFNKKYIRERIWERTNYNLFLQYPLKRSLAKGKYIKDFSKSFPNIISGLKGESYKKAMIIGNAPCMMELDQTTFRALSEDGYLTIGLNRSIYEFQTDILLWSDLLTIQDILGRQAIKRDDCCVIHTPLERNHAIPADKDPAFQALHRYWTENRNFCNWNKTRLYMFRNILTAAFSLCYKLGIREILLVGIGMDDRQYFYKTNKYKKARGYELHSDKKLDKNCGGYDTHRIVREIMEYLLEEEDCRISYNGDSKFLAGIDGLSRIELKDICQNQDNCKQSS